MSKFFRPKPSVISNQYQKWLFDSLPNLMIGDDEAVVTCTFTLLKMATLEYQLNLIGFSTGEAVRFACLGCSIHLL
jgi:capsular polysaccharide biosynthesis protein